MHRLLILILLCNIANGQIWRNTTPILANDPYPFTVLNPIIINDTVYQAQVHSDSLIIQSYSSTGSLLFTQKISAQFAHAAMKSCGLLFYQTPDNKLVALGAFRSGTQLFVDRIYLNSSLQMMQQKSQTFNHNAVNVTFRSAVAVGDSSFALAGQRYFPNPIHILPMAFYYNSDEDTSFLVEYDDRGVQPNSLWSCSGDDIWYHAPDSSFYFMCGTKNDYLLSLHKDLSIKNEALFFPNNISNLSTFRPASYNYSNNKLVLGGCYEGYSEPEFSRGGLLVYDPSNLIITDSAVSPPIRSEEKWYAKHVMANSGAFYLAEVVFLDSKFSTTEARWLEVSRFSPNLQTEWQRIFGPVAGYSHIGMSTFSDGSLFITNRFHNGIKWMLELMRIDTNGNYVGINENVFSQSSAFQTSPNPFVDALKITCNSYTGKTLVAKLYAITGAEMASFTFDVSGNKSIDIAATELPRGTYILCLLDENGNVLFRQKVLKQ